MSRVGIIHFDGEIPRVSHVLGASLPANRDLRQRRGQGHIPRLLFRGSSFVATTKQFEKTSQGIKFPFRWKVLINSNCLDHFGFNSRKSACIRAEEAFASAI